MEALSTSPWSSETKIQFGRHGRARLSHVLWAIVVIAIAGRLTHSFGYQRGLRHISPENGITDNYHRIAENMVTGAGYREVPEHPPTVRRSPAYPVFLYLLFRMFGVDYGIVQVFQALLGGLAC